MCSHYHYRHHHLGKVLAHEKVFYLVLFPAEGRRQATASQYKQEQSRFCCAVHLPCICASILNKLPAKYRPLQPMVDQVELSGDSIGRSTISFNISCFIFDKKNSSIFFHQHLDSLLNRLQTPSFNPVRRFFFFLFHILWL